LHALVRRQERVDLNLEQGAVRSYEGYGGLTPELVGMERLDLHRHVVARFTPHSCERAHRRQATRHTPGEASRWIR
jgi:hypothetical protein